MRTTNYNEAREHFKLAHQIKQTYFRSDHPEIGLTLNSIGNYYKTIGDHDEALTMSQTSATIDDYNQVKCIQSLASLYDKQGKTEQAIQLCSHQVSKYKQDSSSNQLNIAYLQLKMGELYGDNDDRKRDSLRQGLGILEKNTYLEYDTIAYCSLTIAQCYQKQNRYEEAEEYFRKAFEIREKTHPENHSIIIDTQRLLDENTKFMTVERNSDVTQ